MRTKQAKQSALHRDVIHVPRGSRSLHFSVSPEAYRPLNGWKRPSMLLSLSTPPPIIRFRTRFRTFSDVCFFFSSSSGQELPACSCWGIHAEQCQLQNLTIKSPRIPVCCDDAWHWGSSKGLCVLSTCYDMMGESTDGVEHPYQVVWRQVCLSDRTHSISDSQ